MATSTIEKVLTSSDVGLQNSHFTVPISSNAPSSNDFDPHGLDVFIYNDFVLLYYNWWFKWSTLQSNVEYELFDISNYCTPIVKINNTISGQSGGNCLLQIYDSGKISIMNTVNKGNEFYRGTLLIPIA